MGRKPHHHMKTEDIMVGKRMGEKIARLRGLGSCPKYFYLVDTDAITFAFTSSYLRCFGPDSHITSIDGQFFIYTDEPIPDTVIVQMRLEHNIAIHANFEIF